ncbi:MFS transporter [Nocardioides sp. SYSU D00038]|uniref:MFS transporter n=1 Tax=Nocardioides sp. SYSU D00038 TaxID=2812554 RepID=UPI0019685513|nr:MFS transporter [Nocardioides sp. SYSU D00038]
MASTSAFSNYRRVLAEPGAMLFSVTGLFARLPISMVGLGIVLLVEGGTGSYGIAGAVSAAYMVAQAVVTIFLGRLVDRLGQAPVLTAASVVFGVSMSLLVTSVEADWAIATSYAFAALGGASLPPVGSCVRARWAHVLEQPTDVQTAFALEAVFDEAVFILGPILVTVLATSIDPVVGIGTGIVAGVVGSLAFAAQRGTAPPPHPHDRTSGDRPRMPWRTVAPLGVVGAMLGILFGAAEVTTVAFADERDAKQYAGVLLALWALGSLLAGLVSGAISWRRGPSVRVKVGALAMAAAMSPLVLVESMPVMGVLLLCGGVAIAPTLIASLSLIERTVPAARLTEGMSIMHTGIVAGVAPGATLSGFVVDHRGASAAYLVSFGAGLVAALAALTLPPERSDAPASEEDLEAPGGVLR